MTNYIIWNADPELFSIGFIHLRYYGLLFALGFIISQQILYYIHKREGKPLQDVDTLTVYMVVATIIGARLGHVFFYEPEKYLANPIDILMIHKGGLASHGAAIGILIGLWVYANYDITFAGIKPVLKKIKREGQSYLQILDRIVILVAMTGALIRIGNYMNSEIEGMPSGSDTGVFFARNVSERLTGSNQPIDHIDYVQAEKDSSSNGFQPVKLLLEFKAGYEEGQVRYYLENQLGGMLQNDYYIKRHIQHDSSLPLKYELINDSNRWNAIVLTHAIVRYPTQLIEATGYFLVFVFLLLLWIKHKAALPEGRIFGWFLIVLFGLRIVFEFFKANQVDFEEGMLLNMGQLLSVPLVIAGIVVLIRSYRKS